MTDERQYFELRCSQCGWLAGQCADSVNNYTCNYCIQERRFFNWIFSGLPESLERNEYWEEYNKNFPDERPHRSHQIRFEETKSFEAFTVALYSNPDILKVNEND